MHVLLGGARQPRGRLRARRPAHLLARERPARGFGGGQGVRAQARRLRRLHRRRGRRRASPRPRPHHREPGTAQRSEPRLVVAGARTPTTTVGHATRARATREARALAARRAAVRLRPRAAWQAVPEIHGAARLAARRGAPRRPAAPTMQPPRARRGGVRRQRRARRGVPRPAQRRASHGAHGPAPHGATAHHGAARRGAAARRAAACGRAPPPTRASTPARLRPLDSVGLYRRRPAALVPRARGGRGGALEAQTMGKPPQPRARLGGRASRGADARHAPARGHDFVPRPALSAGRGATPY